MDVPDVHPVSIGKYIPFHAPVSRLHTLQVVFAFVGALCFLMTCVMSFMIWKNGHGTREDERDRQKWTEKGWPAQEWPSDREERGKWIDEKVRLREREMGLDEGALRGLGGGVENLVKMSKVV
ncbi:MAG: hypothetical protein M1824_002861 [Vezdaea acicularis]|nr:MAG: hypothetical protein M1824_002861 [Vezdaea acicularis]